MKQSKAKSELDWVIHKAKEGPGPGSFDIEKAEQMQKEKKGGGKFNQVKILLSLYSVQQFNILLSTNARFVRNDTVQGKERAGLGHSPRERRARTRQL